MNKKTQKCLNLSGNDQTNLSVILYNRNSREKLNSSIKKLLFFLFSRLSLWLVKFIAINITIANSNYF